MKTSKQLVALVLTGAIFIGHKSDTRLQNIHQSPMNNVEDFAISVFSSIKSNDFNSFIALLPSAPFTLNLSSLGRRKKEDIIITAEAFTQLKENYQNQFNLIILALHAQGLTLNDIELDKIIAEFDRDEDFKVTEIYLILSTPKGRYRIRIEDCLKVESKYLPAQLKWYGQTP